MKESLLRPRKQEEGKLEQGKVDVAREKAERILASPKFSRISTASFSNYDKRQVEQDEKLVESLRQKWHLDTVDPRDLQEGTIGEGFVFDMVGNTNWFGDASIRRTSEFDDYVNDVDAILGLHVAQPSIASTSYLALGLDATTSRNGVAKKINNIAGRVRSGALGKIKYAEIDNFKGEMNQIPETVLYIERKTFFDVIDRWTIPSIQKKSGKDAGHMNDETMRRFNELATHPLQLEFLAQIYVQLDAFSKLTTGASQDRLKGIGKIMFRKIQERSELLKVGKEALSGVLQSESVNQVRGVTNRLT